LQIFLKIQKDNGNFLLTCKQRGLRMDRFSKRILMLTFWGVIALCFLGPGANYSLVSAAEGQGYGQVLHNPDWKTTGDPIREAPHQSSAPAGPVTMDFIGLANYEYIQGYYSGETGSMGSGPGPDYGVRYSDDSMAIISAAAGGSGNFTNNPSGSTIMFFLSGSAAVMTLESGFKDGLSLYYCAANTSGSVEIYSGLAGTGDLLATVPLPVTPPTGQTPYTFDNWQFVQVTFGGIARSVAFAGAENQIGFDNVTIFNNDPMAQARPIPTLSEWGMIIMSLILAGSAIWMMRRRQVS
jgi:hypothetical protein